MNTSEKIRDFFNSNKKDLTRVLELAQRVREMIEGARGKAVRREIYERVSIVGLGVVLLLFFVGLTNDIGDLL